MVKELPGVSIVHEQYGKLTICGKVGDIKPLLKKKFKIVAQNNTEEIVWIQLEENKQIIPLTFTVMIHLLRN